MNPVTDLDDVAVTVTNRPTATMELYLEFGPDAPALPVPFGRTSFRPTSANVTLVVPQDGDRSLTVLGMDLRGYRVRADGSNSVLVSSGRWARTVNHATGEVSYGYDTGKDLPFILKLVGRSQAIAAQMLGWE